MGADQNAIDQQQAQYGGLQSVGAALAAAREKKQLSIESVAADLHLRPEVLRALETGTEAKLPAQAFVHGYIRSYARLLGLEVGPLLAQLPQVTEQRSVPLKRVGMRRRSISLPIGKWLVRGLVLAAVLLVLVFAAPLVERLWSDKPPQPVSDALQIPEPGSTTQLEYIDLPAPDDAEVPDAVPMPDIATPEESAESPVLPVRPEPVPETAPVQDVAGPAVVTLRFTEDSWVEMEAHGRKLVVGTQRADSERTVTVEPPIFVLLGNAPAVELIYRGKPVDLTPFQRGNVARITLED